MARRMIPAKLEEQLQKLNSNISEDGKLYLNGLVDADGNPRFVEGDLELSEIEGVSFTYGKWSLSGTHLMIVLAGNIANGTALTTGTYLAQASLPSYIFDKIYPTFLATILRESQNYWGEDYSSQASVISLIKTSTKLAISTNALTATADREFRIAFDLLIDTEAGE